MADCCNGKLYNHTILCMYTCFCCFTSPFALSPLSQGLCNIWISLRGLIKYFWFWFWNVSTYSLSKSFYLCCVVEAMTVDANKMKYEQDEGRFEQKGTACVFQIAVCCAWGESQHETQTVHKDERYKGSPKVKPKHLDHPLVAGCSVGHKLCLLHVSGWNMVQSKKSNTNFSKMVSSRGVSCTVKHLGLSPECPGSLMLKPTETCRQQYII